MKSNKLACCLGLLFAASTCFAQMYTVTDLGTLGRAGTVPTGINSSGQVVGYSWMTGSTTWHAFRTAPNSPINPATDDLGTLGGTYSYATGINDSGQVVGSGPNSNGEMHGFRTAANQPINPATDDLGNVSPEGINDSGQVVGSLSNGHAFRTAPNSPVNPATDDLDILGGIQYSAAKAINASGQVAGAFVLYGDDTCVWGCPFRTAPNSPINPTTDNLGTLATVPGLGGGAEGINDSGQVVGSSAVLYSDSVGHLYHACHY